MGKQLKYARDFVEYGDSKIVDEWFDGGVRVAIMSCRGSHFTAYFGIPKEHPLAKIQSYDDLPLDVHGGLTFSGSGRLLSDDFYWYGWDYAHVGDKTYHESVYKSTRDEHDWTIDEVKKEAESALYDFKKLVNLAEVISNKS